jgi:hypothetical protein
MNPRLFVFVAVLAAVLFTGTPVFGGKNYAIFVGVNDYSTSKNGAVPLDDLLYCVTDMVALRDAFVKAKFVDIHDTRLLTSETDSAPTKENVLNAIHELLEKISSDDTILFAFAGHGLSLADDGKTGDVICCSDAKIVRFGRCEGLIFRSELEQMLSLDQTSTNQRTVPQSKIFMFDACRNIPGAESLSGSRSIRGFGDTINSQAQILYPGIIRLASCAPGQVSHEGKDGVRHGLFTYNVIKGLGGEADKKSNNGNGDGRITLNELFDFAGAQTRSVVQGQTPTKTETELVVSTSAFVMGYCDPETPPTVTPATSGTANTGSQTRNVGSSSSRNSGGGVSRSGSGR